MVQRHYHLRRQKLKVYKLTELSPTKCIQELRHFYRRFSFESVELLKLPAQHY